MFSVYYGKCADGLGDKEIEVKQGPVQAGSDHFSVEATLNLVTRLAKGGSLEV